MRTVPVPESAIEYTVVDVWMVVTDVDENEGVLDVIETVLTTGEEVNDLIVDVGGAVEGAKDVAADVCAMASTGEDGNGAVVNVKAVVAVVEDTNHVGMEVRAVVTTDEDATNATVDVGVLVEGANDVNSAAPDVARLNSTVVGFRPTKLSRDEMKPS